VPSTYSVHLVNIDVPFCKGRRVRLKLPPIVGAADLVTALTAVADAMARGVLSAEEALCAYPWAMRHFGVGRGLRGEGIEEYIEQVYGRDEETISIATGYRKPLDFPPSVATVITEDDIRAIRATTLGQVIDVSTTN
jgi:hypothetical protein